MNQAGRLTFEKDYSCFTIKNAQLPGAPQEEVPAAGGHLSEPSPHD